MSILSRALAARKLNPFGQFGQPNDSLTNGGATGCTDTCLQFLAKLVKNVWYTHNQIRQRIGHSNPLTGLNTSEVGAWFRAVGMPYVVANAHPAVLALDLTMVPGNDESGVGRTILDWLSPASA